MINTFFKSKDDKFMDNIKIQKNTQYIDDLAKALNKNVTASWQLFQMAYEVEKIFLKESNSDLMAVNYLPTIKFMPHQIDTAKKVIGEMSGRAILADEVGLGKTIEACLILKEYMVRGLVNKVLILVPASLINQWIDELNNKFHINAVAHRKNMCWKSNDIVVASIDTAKRQIHQEKILDIKYDLVIIDEAHKLKNENTINYQFVSSIKKVYCLLLTATPIQNRLTEIFNLISIIRPGLLGNYDYFKKNFEEKSVLGENDPYLKRILKNNLIRNTRRDTDLNDVSRNVKVIPVNFTENEKEVYEKIYKQLNHSHSFTKTMLLRQFCSSREACYLSLKSLLTKKDCDISKNIRDKIKKIPQHSKATEVLRIIKSLSGEKVIIFTEFVPTQYYLQWFLNNHGILSVLYNGKYSKSKKDWMIHLFRERAQVLIATEAASEGINLQFCRNLINYDLPWNPMKVEQRIGRIHRYGQGKDVQIYNLMTKNTIEEHVMTLLYEKLKLFTGVIGNLEKILSNLDISDLEKEIEKIVEESNSDREITIKLNHLTSIINEQNKSI